MKVRELIEELKQQNPDADVVLAHDYGDRIHTTVALPIDDVSEQYVKHSEYHQCDKIADADEIADERAARLAPRLAVVLQ